MKSQKRPKVFTTGSDQPAACQILYQEFLNHFLAPIWRCCVLYERNREWEKEKAKKELREQLEDQRQKDAESSRQIWTRLMDTDQHFFNQKNLLILLEAIEKTTRVNMKVLQSRNKRCTLEKRMHSTEHAQCIVYFGPLRFVSWWQSPNQCSIS